MGPTGAGKSSFVSRATGAAGDGVGHTLTSHTSEIKATRYKIGGASVVLVDTPGFDDTKKSDLEILESIANWLGETYKEGALLSALLYFHRITDNRMAGTPLKNLRVFQRLCGNNAMSQIVLTTTMWDEVDEEVGMERLEELRGSYWKPMIAQGSTTFRYLNTQESAMELIVQLVAKKRREVRLQKEIANKHMELRETSAGQELHSRLDQLAASQMQILERLRTQLKEGPTEDLRKEFETVKAQLNDTMRQSEALKLNSMQRTLAFFRRKIGVSYSLFSRNLHLIIVNQI
ncbi:P-loop containing nucleoside triphosphate hydrolase protein [Scleroderma citrinum]